eukprot:1471201-Rhodomonas_salina.1
MDGWTERGGKVWTDGLRSRQRCRGLEQEGGSEAGTRALRSAHALSAPRIAQQTHTMADTQPSRHLAPSAAKRAVTEGRG